MLITTDTVLARPLNGFPKEHLRSLEVSLKQVTRGRTQAHFSWYELYPHHYSINQRTVISLLMLYHWDSFSLQM